MCFFLCLLPLFLSLASACAQVSSSSDELQIRNKLSLYPIALDTQNFALLDQVFTANTVVDYQIPGTSVLHGLPDVKAYLVKALTGFVTEHTLSTIVVEEINRKGDVNSSAYLVAYYYGQNSLKGQYGFVPGKYFDSWVKEKGDWKIKVRTLQVFVSDAFGI